MFVYVCWIDLNAYEEKEGTIGNTLRGSISTEDEDDDDDVEKKIAGKENIGMLGKVKGWMNTDWFLSS